MSAAPRWSYVQARLQARHGERLQEADWRMIEAARSVDQFLERARASSLRRFTARINARLSSHAAERIVRETWRAYVAEVAGWVPEAWREAVLWTALVPELPIIDGLLSGGAPDWVRDDPALKGLIKPDQQERDAASAKSPHAALIALDDPETTLAARWFAHWRVLWPPHAADEPALDGIAATIQAHIERLDRADLKETSALYRRALALKLTRTFRRHGASSAAVFCHLALLALDLERLRGDLVRRRLFEPADAKDAG